MATASAKKRSAKPRPQPRGRKAVVVLGAGSGPGAAVLPILGELGLVPLAPADGGLPGTLQPVADAIAADAGASEALLGEAAAALEEAYGKGRVALFAVPAGSDPAFWLAALGKAGREPLVLVLLPSAGDALPTLLENELLTRGLPRAFVGEAELLADWNAAFSRIGRALGLRWPRSLKSAAPKVEEIVAMSPAHAAPAEPLPDASAPLGQCLDIFAGWTDGGETRDGLDALDRIRDSLPECAPDEVLEAEAMDLGASLPGPDPALEARIRELEAALEQSRAAEAEARTEAADLSAEVTALQARNAELETARYSGVGGLEEDLRTLEARLETAEAARDELGGEADHLRSALRQREHERDELYRELDALKSARDALAAREAETAGRAAKLEERYARTQRQLTALSRREAERMKRALDEAQDRIAGVGAPTMEEALAERDRRMEETEGELGRTRKELLRLQEDSEMAETERDKLRVTLRQRETELVDQIGQRRALQMELASLRQEADRIQSELEQEREQHEKLTADLRTQHEKLTTDMREQTEHQRLMLEKWIRDMENSTSWRATQPLRTVISALRRSRL
ncbi:hypothetical protein [Mangrovicoccus sp. HB161399]|uniref:hypothetical protein n=1 Tax=Mangrovicoccus sp. HB161399 TaxID=2720392 RepID=UPI0015561A53|nr:hypothetical protein [Mangrovicoccus sp. HB161399]